MKHRFLLLLLLVLGLTATLAAEPIGYKTALGLHFGTSSGNGYSMRWMGRNHGIQGTLGAYTAGKNTVMFDAPYAYDYIDDVVTVREKGKEGSVILGLNYMYMLDHFRSGRLYIFGGGSYQYYQKRTHYMDFQRVPDGTDGQHFIAVPNTKTSELERQHRWTVGVGPGFEFDLGSQFRMSFELPITYNWKDDIVMYIPQAGLYYYFK